MTSSNRGKQQFSESSPPAIKDFGVGPHTVWGNTRVIAGHDRGLVTRHQVKSVISSNLDFRLVKNFPEAFPLSLQIKNLAGSCRVIECAERKGTFGNLQPKCGPFGAEIAVPPGKLGIPRKFHLPTSVRAASGLISQIQYMELKIR
jgi:hypothetical protein